MQPLPRSLPNGALVMTMVMPPIEGGKVVSDTAFYPKKFCQRLVQLWKNNADLVLSTCAAWTRVFLSYTHHSTAMQKNMQTLLSRQTVTMQGRW